jgi:hypothetical protein
MLNPGVKNLFFLNFLINHKTYQYATIISQSN